NRFWSTHWPLGGKWKLRDVLEQPAFDRKWDVVPRWTRDDFEARFGVKLGAIQRRDIHAANSREPRQALAPRKSFALGLDPAQRDLGCRFLAVADQNGVQKRSHRLHVGRYRAAGNHQGIVVTAVLAAKWNAAELEHAEDVRVRELELQRE